MIPLILNLIPTVFQLWDLPLLRAKLPAPIQKYVLTPYINWAKGVVRFQTDVVMVTHLILYFTTIVPSAILLFYRFSYLHGFVHWFMQLFYCGAFTLMKHQHIHMNGVLSPKYYLLDTLFPYLLSPHARAYMELLLLPPHQTPPRRGQR